MLLSRSTVVAAVAAGSMLLAAPCAHASTQVLPLTATGRNWLAFKPGALQPQTIVAARLQAGSHRRALDVRAVRAAARSGRLRIRAPRWARHDARLARASSARASLVVTTTCGTAGSGYGRMVLATAGVRAYYRLDEQAGTSACDLAAGQTGSYGGGYALRRAGALADDPDTSVGFSGGGWTRVPSTPALSPAQALSLEAWIRPYSLTSSQTILRKDGQYLLRIADGRVILRTWSSAGMVELSSPQALRAGAFQHVAGTFDGSALRIYLNGRQIAARSASGRVQATSNALYLGASGGSYDFLGGDVDEVALYGSALSAATVAQHYDAGAASGISPTPTPTPTPTPSSTPTPVATPTPSPSDDPGLGDGELFRSDAWVNAPIPAGAVRDPRSDSIMASFRSFVAAGGAAVTWTRYGQPLYLLSDAEARGAAVRRYSVKQTRYPSPKAYLRNVPIPDSAAPDPGDDGYMTIIDDRPASPTYGCMYDIFEGVRQSDGSWWASSANRNWTDDGNYTPGEGSGPRGSSFAPAAGVLRPEEIGTGRINHALVFAYGRNGPTPVKPSYHSDGGYTGSDALPEGALLRLRPDTDLSALPPGWQVIGRALKEFGSYDVDNGGSSPAFALSALNTTVSSLAWGYGLGWPWGTTAYPTIPATIWQNLELMPMTPQTEVQETPPVSHPCGGYSDTP